MPTPEQLTEPANPGPKSKAKPTEYVVLYMIDGAWHEGGKLQASSMNAAVKLFMATSKTERPALVAVPARSWQPVKPKTTTKTITTLEAL